MQLKALSKYHDPGRPWPTTRGGRSRQVQLALTRLATALITTYPVPRVGPLASLHEFATLPDLRSPEDNTASPSDFAFALRQVVFADIYLTEDLDRLEHGLARLLRRGRRATPIGWNIREVFEEARKSPSLSWRRLGSISPKGLAEEFRSPRIESLSLGLDQITPSTLVVTFAAVPSASTIEEFASIGRRDATSEHRITGFSLRRGVTSSSMYAAQQIRAEEYDRFFLGLNAEATTLARRYFGGGLAALGPMPQVEVITVDRPLSEVAARSEIDGDPGYQMGNFLIALGRDPGVFPFQTPWSHFYRLNEHRRGGTEAFQVLVSLSDYAAAEPTRDIFHSLEDVYRHTAPLLALSAFYGTTWQAVLGLRDDLVSTLYRDRDRVRSTGRLRKLHRKMSRVNAVAFREERVWTELDSRCRSYLDRSGLLSRRTSEDPITGVQKWSTAVLSHVDWLHEHCLSQLSVLRPNYRDFLDARTVLEEHALQRSVWFLAWVSIAIAVLGALLGLVPDQTKVSLWHLLVSRLVDP